jgi:hypothetical protein
MTQLILSSVKNPPPLFFFKSLVRPGALETPIIPQMAYMNWFFLYLYFFLVLALSGVKVFFFK